MITRSFIAIILFLISCSVNTALGGDIATRSILGFSPDGRFFAFEQYGKQAGSGFPYADLIILDTKRNAWVKGSPFRTLLFDPKASPEAARAQSKKKATSLLQQMMISPRGKTLLSNPVTELTNPYKAVFQTRSKQVLNLQPYTLALKTNSLQDQKCRLTNHKTEVLALSLMRHDKQNKKIYLAKESQRSQLHRLRECATDYKIADVLLFDPMQSKGLHKAQAVLVVLLHVIQQGFEGNDGRYLALGYSGALD